MIMPDESKRSLSGVPGIYMIRNRHNGKVYIGQTIDLHRRAMEYNRVRNADHRLIHRELRDSSYDDFEFIVLETCSEAQLSSKERYYAYRYQSLDPNKGYNRTDYFMSPNRNPSEAVRRKMSLSHTGLKESADTKRKKSNTIYAIDTEANLLFVFDSAKLFGDFIGGLGKDMIKNCLTHISRCKGYILLYADKEKRETYVNKKLLNTPGWREKDVYMDIMKFLDSYCVETIVNNPRFTVGFSTYENTIISNIRK